MAVSAMSAASAADALVMLYQALPAAEKAAAFERISELYAAGLASDDSEVARMLRSLRRVCELLGHTPSVDDYKAGSRELIAVGEDIESFARLYAFYGSWALAREALDLAAVSTPRRIEARFRSRRVGKIWRYTDEELGAALAQAQAHCKRVPTIAEFEWWRHRELELAKAKGETLHLPSASPYRKRWGSWEGALAHFGYSAEEISERLGASSHATKPGEEPFVPEDAPVAVLREQAEGVDLSGQELIALVGAYARLPRRSQYILTTRLGLGVEPASLREVARPLGLTVSRISQLQTLAVSELCDAVAPGDPVRAHKLHRTVATDLRLLAGAASPTPAPRADVPGTLRSLRKAG